MGCLVHSLTGNATQLDPLLSRSLLSLLRLLLGFLALLMGPLRPFGVLLLALTLPHCQLLPPGEWDLASTRLGHWGLGPFLLYRWFSWVSLLHLGPQLPLREWSLASICRSHHGSLAPGLPSAIRGSPFDPQGISLSAAPSLSAGPSFDMSRTPGA